MTDRRRTAEDLHRDNEAAGVLNRLIIGLEGLSDTQRELRIGLAELSSVVHEQSDAIETLTATVVSDRQTSQDADKRLSDRIERHATESARRVVREALKYMVPVLTMTGVAAAWLIKEGPSIIVAWWGLPSVLWP